MIFVTPATGRGRTLLLAAALRGDGNVVAYRQYRKSRYVAAAEQDGKKGERSMTEGRGASSGIFCIDVIGWILARNNNGFA
jgi:hypothetical protein